MDQLKKIGSIFANHYEKIILTVILLALLAAAALLPFRVSQNRETIRQAVELVEKGRKKEQQPTDTASIEESIKRSRTAPKLELSGPHNVFNPVVWKKGRDGFLFRSGGDEEGPGGLKVAAIRPLELVIRFEGVQASGESTRFRFSVLDEAKGGRQARPRQIYLAPNSSSKSDPIVLTKVHPPADNPPSVEFRFADSSETVTVVKDEPFKRNAGYEADLAHEKLGSRFSNVRARQPNGIRLSAQTYNIVAITKDEVTVESSTSKKRWTVRLKGAAER